MRFRADFRDRLGNQPNPHNRVLWLHKERMLQDDPKTAAACKEFLEQPLEYVQRSPIAGVVDVRTESGVVVRVIKAWLSVELKKSMRDYL